MKGDILVYFWDSTQEETIPLGTLSLSEANSDEEWSFTYHADFLKTDYIYLFDPCFNLIQNKTGNPQNNSHLSIITDSAPDRWGSTLYQKAIEYKLINVDFYQHNNNIKLHYVEYFQQKAHESSLKMLLKVTDPLRKGALQFKTSTTGPFLEQDTIKAVPGIDYLEVIEKGLNILESDTDAVETEHTLKTLLSPAASLGGSKPKCSVRDHKDQLWIAKCPSIYDQSDRGAWEYLIWLLAKQTGITVPEAGLQKGLHEHHIFLSKRFDRVQNNRIHFISGNAAIRMISPGHQSKLPGYLHLSEFIQFQGAQPKNDLEELWRRLIFNLTISNHDDHLKNHGFLLTQKGWKLAPAFDLNPASTPGQGDRSLSIEYGTRNRSLESAFEIGKYMQLTEKEMKQISEEVFETVSSWKTKAAQLEIKKDEIEAMNRAFLIPKKFRQHSGFTPEPPKSALKKSFFRDLKERKKSPPDDPS